MTTLEYRAEEVKSSATEVPKASRPPGVLLMSVIVAVIFGLAAVSLLSM